MKLSLFLLLHASLGWAIPAAVADESAAPPPASGARVLGGLADGTPQVPESEKPTFVVHPEDILGTETFQQGGREVVIQRIQPIALPEPVGASGQLSAARDSAAGSPQEDPEEGSIRAGVTVFRPADSPPLSYVRVWPEGAGEPVTLWSSADFGYLSGFSSFAGAGGKSYGLMLTWGVSQARTLAEVSGEMGPDSPLVPDFPPEIATFTIVSTTPVLPETLAAIQALHDLYNNRYEELKAASEGRERARLEQEAEAKANPPEKRPITLRYWRTETPAPPQAENDGTAAEGGER